MTDAQIRLYEAYLDDLGRIGDRHEKTRKFYISAMSALFVFLSMAGKDGIFVNVQGPVFGVVAVVGILICVAWFEHMRSFGALYRAKFDTLRTLEKWESPSRPFTIETEALTKSPSGPRKKWRYTPITFIDRITPFASALLFVGLFVFQFLT